MAEKGSNRDDREQEADLPQEEETAETPSTKKKKRKFRQKKRNEEFKSKATGTGLKISLDSAPKNNKIVFDDSNLPSEDEDDTDDNDNANNNEQLNLEATSDQDSSDDDDAVEEVKGTAARDEALDLLKTEAEQSLKTKKKRKRKPRKEKVESDDEEAEMDDDFFAQLDSVREAEMKERKELEESAAREAMKGKHTTFVFAKNKSDEDGPSGPVDVNENIQVVVLNNNNIGEKESLSEKALVYSRNRLTSGADPLAGPVELKRKRMRSGPEVQPWKRAKKGLALGRSRLRKGKPSAFFKRKKR